MGKLLNRLTGELTDFIRRQPIFFVATAVADCRINLSPKGMDTFRVLGARHVAWLDLTASGNETAAHLLHDGRITIMFCSFDAAPQIVRLYGRGEVVRPPDPQWDELMSRFHPREGRRQIINVQVESVGTSCGFGVPIMQFKEHRQMLIEWAEKKGSGGLRRYELQKNIRSIDGLDTPTGREVANNTRPQ